MTERHGAAPDDRLVSRSSPMGSAARSSGDAAGDESRTESDTLDDPGDEITRERERHRLRRLSVFPDDDGMYVVRGRLTPEVGAVLMRALQASEDALFRRERAAGEGAPEGNAQAEAAATKEDPADRSGEPPSPRRARREARRRRADAVVLLAERALAAGFGGEDGHDVPISGSRAERYQVLLHADAATLEDRGDGRGEEDAPGCSELGDGTRVAAETARRLGCDAAATPP